MSVVKSFGTHIKSFEKAPFFIKSVEIPDNFHFAGTQLVPTRNQEKCGSCWAFAITSSLHNRIAIYSQGKIKTALAPQHLMDCLQSSGGCDGAVPEQVVQEIIQSNFKIVPETVYPYTAQDGTCQQKTNSYSVGISDYHALSGDIETVGSPTHLKYIENIKQNIYQYGPIVFCMQVYDSFMKYDGLTIYEKGKDETTPIGGHAILGVGWGKTPDGIEYWVCRNSWGDKWPAENVPYYGTGVFFMKMNTNCCGIEEQALGALPKVYGANVDTSFIPTPEEMENDGYYDTNLHRFRRHRVDPVPPNPILHKDTLTIVFFAIAMLICVATGAFLLYNDYRVLATLVFVVILVSIIFFLHELDLF